MKNCPTKWLFLTIITFIVSLSLLIASCDSNGRVSEKLLTEQEKQAEIQQIIETINTYNQAANEKSWQKMVSTLADEIMFFGTDRGESAKNFNEFKNTMQKQWDDYEVLSYGALDTAEAFISIDDYARYANVIYGSYVVFGKKAAPDTFYTVTQRTLKKDIKDNKWLIESGILAVLR